MSELTTVEVRPATLRDAAKIAELYAATAKEAFKTMQTGSSVLPVPEQKGTTYWREAIEYAEPQVQVAVDGNKIIGFGRKSRRIDKCSQTGKRNRRHNGHDCDNHHQFNERKSFIVHLYGRANG